MPGLKTANSNSCLGEPLKIFSTFLVSLVASLDSISEAFVNKVNICFAKEQSGPLSEAAS